MKRLLQQAKKKLRIPGAALARNWAERIAFPRAYSAAARQPIDPNLIIFAEDASSLMPQELAPAFSFLQESYELDVQFRGLARSEGIGWREYFQRRTALVQELAKARAIVTTDDTPVVKHLKIRPGTLLITIPRNFDEPQILSKASSLASLLSPAPKPPSHERMAARNPVGPDVSIVIPAYNAAATLPHTIESILAQDYPLDRIEVIVVDDCSTDGTWEALPSQLAKHPGLSQALRTAVQSGTPAAPRNLGLAAAQGEFVLFVDADDWLGPEAIRRMLGHALDWNSDVLLVKLIGEGGREVPKSMFTASQPVANIYTSKVMWTLSPLKLFRRSLIKGIRFPENCMPEDIGFVLRAYVAAGIVSVAADYDYYHVAAEQGDSNASVTTWDNVESNLRAYADVFGLIAKGPRELQTCKPLMRRLFGRDVVNTLKTIELNQEEAQASSMRQKLRIICIGAYDEEMLRTLPDANRELLVQVFTEQDE